MERLSDLQQLCGDLYDELLLIYRVTAPSRPLPEREGASCRLGRWSQSSPRPPRQRAPSTSEARSPFSAVIERL